MSDFNSVQYVSIRAAAPWTLITHALIHDINPASLVLLSRSAGLRPARRPQMYMEMHACID